MSRIVASRLRGKTVVAKDGTEIGRVEDVEVDPESWRVTAIHVDVRRSILEKLHIDEPVIAGGKSLLLEPDHVERIAEGITLRDDVWDVGRMKFV